MVAWLVRALQAEGHVPAIVSRGYRGRAGRGPVIVSRGAGPLVTAQVAGDEPFLLARSLPGAIVVVGSDRIAGVRAARAEGAHVALLDDGFQHRRIRRDVDIVLLDASNPFGNYRLIPAGILREPLSALARADAVVVTRARPAESLVVIDRVVRRYHSTAPILRAGHRREGFVDRDGNPVERPKQALAFCGIGNPTTFPIDLAAAGVHVTHVEVFPDHHAYSDADFERLAQRARAENAALVTTEKDIVRLPPAACAPNAFPVVALRISAELHHPEPLLALVREALRERAA
jgi:tetraacyldisaccharide 4'-kinase